MANKKISELESRASLSLSDLMAVGDPSTGYLYKTTISDLKTLTGAGVVSFNGRFGTVNPAEGDYTLTQLGDVIITSATNGQVLQYNGSNWVNTTLPADNDTLDIVTGRGNTTANSITVGSVTAAGLSNLLGQIRTFATTGNTYIGANPASATDAGYKLDVNGFIRASQLATGAHSFRNEMYITSTTDGYTKQNSYNGASAFTMGFIGDLRFGSSTAIKSVFSFNGAYSNNGTVYSGDVSLIKIFTSDALGNPTPSANINGYGINLMPTLNYTQSTSNFTGIYYNPTLTATTGLTHYAMNLVAGLVRMGTLAGTGSRLVAADASGNLSATTALGDFVTTNTTQTITAQKTFTSNVILDGYAYIKESTAGATISGYTQLIYHADGFSYINSASTKGALFTYSGLRLYTLPNANGTLALTSDIPSLTNYVTLDGTQTITGLKTFSGLLTANGNIKATYYGFADSNGYSTGFESTSNNTIQVKIGSGLAINIASNNNTTFYGNIIRNGGTSSQFLKADGSLDSSTYLTSSSVAGVYLPLSGGTLTGALNGTTASFSGAVLGTCTTSTNGDAFRAYATASGGAGSQPGIGYYTSAGSKRFINQLDVTSDSWSVTGTTGTNYLLIAQTGAATFSSSVTATSLMLGTTLSNEQLMVGGTGSRGIGVSTTTSGDPFVRLYDNTTIKADMWWDRTGGYMGINSIGSGSKTAINPFGGNVGIGTTAPLTTFTVKSTNDNGYALTRPSDASSLHWRLSTTESGGDAYTVRYNTFNNEMLFTTYTSGGTGGNIIFRTGSSGGGSETTRMTISPTGLIFMNNLGGYSASYADVRYDTSSKELYYQTSSKRYKTDIVDIENVLGKVNQLRPVRYKDIKSQGNNCGLIAEEVVEIIPDVVFKKQIDGFDQPQCEGINYSDFVPFLIKAIQEQQSQIESLKKQIA